MADNSDKRNKYIADAESSWNAHKPESSRWSTPLSVTLMEHIQKKEYSQLEEASKKDLTKLSEDEKFVLFWRAAVDENPEGLKHLLGNNGFKAGIADKASTMVLWFVVDILDDKALSLKTKVGQSSSFETMVANFGQRFAFNEFESYFVKAKKPVKYTNDQFKTLVLELGADVGIKSTSYANLFQNPAINSDITNSKITNKFFKKLFHKAYNTEDLYKADNKLELAKFLNQKSNDFFKIDENFENDPFVFNPKDVVITPGLQGFIDTLDTYHADLKGAANGSSSAGATGLASKDVIKSIKERYEKLSNVFEDLKKELEDGIKDDPTYDSFKQEIDSLKSNSGGELATSLKPELKTYLAYMVMDANNKSILADDSVEIDKQLCLVSKKGADFIVRKITLDTSISVDLNSVVTKEEIKNEYYSCMKTRVVSEEFQGGNIDPTTIDGVDYLISELGSYLT